MTLDPWKLSSEGTYEIHGDAEVKLLMLKLGVPELFQGARGRPGPTIALTAFDNHPTHWIAFFLWAGLPEYSPNHGIHKVVGNASANGLLFTAQPKASTTKSDYLKRLRKHLADEKGVVPLSQFPFPGNS